MGNEKNAFMQMETLMNQAPCGIGLFDIDTGLPVFLNDEYYHIVGYTKKEYEAILSHSTEALVFSKDMKTAQQSSIDFFEHKEGGSYEYRIVRKDGQVLWIKLNISSVELDGKQYAFTSFTDITKEKDAYLQINMIAENVTSSISLMRVSKNVEELIYANDRFYELTGVDREHYRNNESFFAQAFISAEDHKRIAEAVRYAFESGQPGKIEHQFYRPDGKVLWLSRHYAAIRQEQPDTYMLVSVVTDITERREAELKAALEQRRYQLVIDELKAVVFEWNLKDGSFYCSKAYQNYELGHVKQEDILNNRGPADVIHPDDNAIMQKFFQDTASGKERVEAVLRLKMVDGSYRWSRMIGFYFKDDNGQPNRTIGVIIDINEEKEKSFMLNSLLNEIPGGIGIYEIRDGKVSVAYLNDTYYAMLGDKRENREKYYGENALEAVYVEDRVAISAAIQSIVRGMDKVTVLHRVENSEGKLFWLNLAGSVVERREHYIKVYASFTDCNDMMDTQRDLQNNRMFLNVAMESAQIMAWKYDCKKDIIEDSGPFGELYHLPKVITRILDTFFERNLIEKESIEDFKWIVKHARDERKVQKDICMKAPDGNGIRWFQFICAPVFDKNGVFVATVGTCVDITERKEKEARYLRKIDSMSEVDDENLLAKGRHSLTKNDTLFFQGKHKGALTISESSTYDEALEKLSDLALLPEQKQRILKTMARKRLLKDFEQDKLEGSIEYQRIMPDEEISWASTRYSLFEEPSTGEVVIFIYSYDITDRVLNSQIVSKLSGMEYDALGLLNVKTHDYVLRDILVKLESPTIVGKGNFDERVKSRMSRNLVPSEKELVQQQFQVENIVKHLETEEVYFFTYSIIDDEKEIRRKKMQFTYLDDMKATILYCRSDITEIYKREKEQLHQTELALLAAQEASRAKSTFLSRMSHDIRTPMNTIVNLTRLVKEELDDKEAALEDLKKIETANQFLLSLVNDILDMSRIEQQNMQLHPEYYDYQEFLNYIRSTFEPLCAEKNIKLTIEKGTQNVALMIDKVRFNQLCSNLLSNAIKYTPEGGHVWFTMVHGSIENGKLPCELCVIDNGIGMSKEFQDKMFEPFEQEGRAFKSVEGTGLGLAIVKEIVELFGGTIEVKSEMNKGTTFRVHMSIQVASDETEEKSQKPLDFSLLNGKHILLAEDHPLNQEIARRLLSNVGISVTVANNGQEAVEEFEANFKKYDAVLMDMRMPVMDGLQAARCIRELSVPTAKVVPIIAMTANAFSEDRYETAAAGMNAHLAKPIEPNLLYETLAQYITS